MLSTVAKIFSNKLKPNSVKSSHESYTKPLQNQKKQRKIVKAATFYKVKDYAHCMLTTAAKTQILN